jgi:hypothetical protein
LVQLLAVLQQQVLHTLVGSIPGVDRVVMADNGTQLVITTNGAGYVFNGSATTAITDPDFRVSSGADFLDSYILFVERDSGRFFGSDLADATAYDALDFATAEGAPDNLLTLRVDHRQIILFGADSTEVWWDAGSQGFPFERAPNGFIEMGCAAAQGVAKQDNSVFWLASDRTMRRLDGATAVRISQHGVEYALKSYPTVVDAQAFSYTYAGHLFVAWRFPTAGATWVFDVSTQEWHERESYGSAVWSVIDAAQAYGNVYVQHAETGAIGYFDSGTYTDWGGTLRDERTFAPVYSENKRMFHSQLEIVCETGIGYAVDPGADPTIRLEYSDDGGRNWKAFPEQSLGKIGATRTRVQFQRLGVSRDRVYRTIKTDPVRLVFTDAQLSVDVGSS